MNINVSSTSASSLDTIRPNRVQSSTHNTDSEFSTQQNQEIKELKARDKEVRAHEAAHIAAGHGLVRGGASYSFQRGPDGIQYAIGGEVNIDITAVNGDPEATLQKASQIQAAALAPAQPSAQDRSVAAKAAKMAVEARAEINTQQKTEPEQKVNQFNSTAPSENTIDFTA